MAPFLNYIGSGGAAPEPVSFAYVGTHRLVSANTTYLFTTVGLGTATAGRRNLFEICGSNNTRTVSGVKVHIPNIGADPSGTNITGFIVRDQGGGFTGEAWMDLLPTGTTCDVAVTWSGAQAHCEIGVYATYGLLSNTPIDSDTFNPVDGAGSTVILTTVNGGFLIAFGGSYGIAAPTAVWSSTGGITEDFDPGNNPNMSSASKLTTGTSTTFNVTFNNTGNGNHAGIGLSFG